MTDTLFDPNQYGSGKAPRKSSDSAGPGPVEKLVYPWVLLANRSGVIGFHVPKDFDDKYSMTMALCGVKGHVVNPPPDRMVRCVDCSVRNLSGSAA